MILRIAAVFAFMVRYLCVYTFRRLFRPAGLDRDFEATYLQWARFVLRTFDADLIVEGQGNIPAADGRPLVITCNHQSQLDIPSLITAVNRRVGFVAKKELSRIPILSFWMREIGCVFIDRSDRSGAHRALEEAAREMGRHPIVVFPEGTRSRTGQLLPLKVGGFRLALLAKARVLPVLIIGSRDAVENRKPGAPLPVPVRLRIFPPLDTADMEDGKASLNRVKDYVDACWRSESGAHVPPASADAATR